MDNLRFPVVARLAPDVILFVTLGAVELSPACTVIEMALGTLEIHPVPAMVNLIKV